MVSNLTLKTSVSLSYLFFCHEFPPQHNDGDGYGVPSEDGSVFGSGWGGTLAGDGMPLPLGDEVLYPYR